MSTINFNPSVSGSIPAGQGHMCEQFIGDGQKHTFDLREVPSSIHDMTARVSRPLCPTALVIGNLRLDTFAGGYDALVDRVGKRIYLEHALRKRAAQAQIVTSCTDASRGVQQEAHHSSNIWYHTGRGKEEADSGVSRHCLDPPQRVWTRLEGIHYLLVHLQRTFLGKGGK